MPRRVRAAARTRIRRFTALAAATAVLSAAAVTASAHAEPPSPQTRGTARPAHVADSQTVESFRPSGPTGHRTGVPTATPEDAVAPHTALGAEESAADGRVSALRRTGPSAERLDLVLVGDGYTADQLADFHADAEAQWAEVTAVEPYGSNTDKMNVWTVDAVSNESGVSGDPSQDVRRDTALGSYFWCDGLERLLCADLDKVNTYAAQAPAADIVVVVANSAKYGGAGYNRLTGYPFDGVSTLSSDNSASGLIAVHEMAHSIGRLADEYGYGESGTYQGPEPEDVNISTYSAQEMAQRQTKWHTWLGKDDPAGGQTGTFEGAGYYEKGLYRPTETSLMRDFSVREFNNPSRQGLIDGFARYTNGG
ncbi:M64 family metallopeptidase [Streptomyces diacarni]|uniref:M64 family metallopeptidase n=1 Tax=Streptomyces diacarni TaxID=2800381 RepID=UPI0034002080